MIFSGGWQLYLGRLWQLHLTVWRCWLCKVKADLYSVQHESSPACIRALEKVVDRDLLRPHVAAALSRSLRMPLRHFLALSREACSLAHY
jgi:hypothetical protein